ncbi:hypothetical protein [Streptomyces azureus]|uniref:hypothetical protein n=1 Tax=Streptomyces azureus TaxID=146537 RepID=UPI001F1B8CC9|nr:hypothetical protein [Streptomyces azureus]
MPHGRPFGPRHLSHADDCALTTKERRYHDPTRPLARPCLYGIATNLVGQHRRAEARPAV